MSTEPANVPTVPRRRWGLRLLVAAGLLLALVWVAPLIIAHSPAVGWACDQAAEHIDGSIRVGGASLGWFSPVILTDVELRDRDHQPVLRVARVETGRTLLGLLLDRTDLGTLRLEKPKVEWNFAGNDSNVERLLARYLKPAGADATGKDAPPPTVPQIHLEVVDGAIAVFDGDTKLFWKAHGLAFSAIAFNDPARTIQVNLSGALHDGAEAGTLKAEVQIQNALSAHPRATIKTRFSCFPLAVTNVLLRRYQPGAMLSGSLQGHCQMSATLKQGRPAVEVVGEVTANQVHLDTPSLADHFFLERLSAPCRLVLDGSRLVVERAELAGDFGKATLQGAIDFDRTPLAALDRPDFDFTAQVNLAVLAERLPKTFHLHHDIRINTGQLTLTCKSIAQGDTVLWQGKLHTGDIRGIKGKQTIAWSDPIRVDFKARNLSKGVPLVDELKCTARFLTLDASATPEQFTLTADADLNQLVEPLSQFVNIDALKLTGRATAGIVVRRTENDRFSVQGNAQVKQVNLTWLTKEPWREESISARFNATGRIDREGRQAIETGSFEANLGKDVVVAGLQSAIPDLAAGPWGTLGVRVTGDLTRWRNRVRGWTPLLDDWFLEGQATLLLQLRPDAQTVECLSADLHATDLRCIGAGLWINEPTAQVKTSGTWNARTGRLDLGLTKLTCATAQVEAAQLVLDPGRLTLQTAVSVTGDLARLRQWTQDPRARPSDPVEGSLTGRFEVQTIDQRITSEFSGTIKNLVYGPRNQPTWREPEVKSSGRAVYDRTTGLLRLDPLRVAGATIGADLKGTVANVTTTTDLDLEGTLRYDLDKMEPQLRPYLGKDVKIAGKDARPCKVAGPLYPKDEGRMLAVSISPASESLRFTELKGQGSFDWKSLKAYGCDVGPAQVRAVLQQGWLQIYPIEATLNGGKLRLQPNLRLDPAPVEIVLLAGPVIEKARITPAMCAGGLAYAVPALANVTEAEGTISLALEGGRIPLAAPTLAEVKGTLTLHTARVGPSPVIRELSSLLKMPPPTSLARECQVPFHMIGGKVHHRDLELVFPEFTLKSSGTVGVDGTLAIVVEMPLPARLVAGAKLTPAQAKQMLRIPIGGTIEQPRPDPRALESLGAILGRSILENQLNRLLQPKR